MGLDVSLYKFTDYEATRKLEREASEEADRVWTDDYNSMTDEEKEASRQKSKDIYKSHGLDKHGEDSKRKERIELDSKKYPKYYMKIGYFRSSYNSGGMNNVTDDAIGMTLYDVFPHEDGDYYIPVNWDEALSAIKDMIRQMKKIQREFPYRAECHKHNEFRNKDDHKVTDERKALDVFKDHLKKHKENKKSFDAYSCGDGEFSIKEPRKIHAIIQGTHRNIFSNNETNPCTYLVYKMDYGFYIHSLEIVKETIEYVLSQESPEQYYLGWSS